MQREAARWWRMTLRHHGVTTLKTWTALGCGNATCVTRAGW
jgi:hypothetical protein